MKKDYGSDSLSAFEAKVEAQKLAFGPIMFQAARSLRDLGILEIIHQSGDCGLSHVEIAEKLHLSPYGVEVLLDAGLSIGIVRAAQGKYLLTKMGFFVENDPMSRINMDFVHHICYQPMFHLKESVETGKPAGLSYLGDWETIYQGLLHLTPEAKKSWFDFDHYYSDQVFPAALPLVFENKPKKILDIGGNTGKWAIHCAAYNQEVWITLIDHPRQIEEAIKKVREKGFEDRVDGVVMDLLDKSLPLPRGYDALWMSQFLDCFAPDEISHLLSRAAAAMDEHSFLYILEPYWDRQKYPISSYSLNATSLYFTCIANGNSRMYHSGKIEELIHLANLEIVKEYDNLGDSHTLMVCRKKGKGSSR